MGNFHSAGVSREAGARGALTAGLRRSNRPRALVIALILLAFFVMVAAPGTAFAVRRVSRRHRILHHIRGLLWNPMFRPSHDSLIRQNEEIDRIDLPRIQDDEELEALKARATWFRSRRASL
jgi:hypothetical protein